MAELPINLMTLSASAEPSELEDVAGLLRQYRARVLRFVALSIADRDAADSITQDCFLKAYNSRNQFRGDCSVSTWLMRIAFNLIRDHTRTQKFRFWKAATAVDIDDLSPYLASENSSPEQQLLAKEQVSMVEAALKQLSTRQRSVFLMRFVEDMDLPEIASATGMPVQTVKTHLYRAVGAIRSRFGTKSGASL